MRWGPTLTDPQASLTTASTSAFYIFEHQHIHKSAYYHSTALLRRKIMPLYHAEITKAAETIWNLSAYQRVLIRHTSSSAVAKRSCDASRHRIFR